ncbi:MAG: hypothetical protein A2Y17_06375 [Clostridiales bacterium GWF2_38_85]|nr:MAG: hypothetical protein A2Y17_06375 [Clostridiales bacterium GWF2_38_85]HBL85519.1 hypothetical protein [Clostridiales bacterium]
MRKFIVFCLSVYFLLILFSCENTGNESTLSDTSNAVSEVSDPIEIINKDGYTMKITSQNDGKQILEIIPEAQDYSNETPYQPYRNIFSTEPIILNVNNETAPDYKTELVYKKREDGNYIYSNNLEML